MRGWNERQWKLSLAVFFCLLSLISGVVTAFPLFPLSFSQAEEVDPMVTPGYYDKNTNGKQNVEGAGLYSAREVFNDEDSVFGFCPSSFDGRILDPVPLDMSDAIMQSKGNRKYTIEELFGKTLSYTLFHGNTHHSSGFTLPKLFLANKDSGVTGERPDALGRDVWHCLSAPLSKRTIPNGILRLSSIAVKYIQQMTTSIFSQSFVCKDPDADHQPEPCINLLKIIGGRGLKGEVGDMGSRPGGFLKGLSEGLFFPLFAFMASFSALYILWVGIALRHYRLALNMTLWILLVLLLGTFVWRFPGLVARAPQTVNNAVTSCLIGAMSGENCFDSGVSGNMQKSLIGPECLSYSRDASGLEQTEFLVNGLNCSIWKTFILEPWSRSTFGYGLDSDELKKGGLPPIPMFSSKTPKDITGTFFDDSITGNEGGAQPNLAYSWLSLMSGHERDESKDKTGKKPEPPELAKQIAQIVADEKEDKMWSAFVGGSSRFSETVIALVAIVFITIIFIKMGFFGLVYSFLSSLLLVFAPFFLLLAIHYGKGRRIFLGWVETILANLLKFFLTALFMLVTIILFGAILAHTHGLISIITVIILGLSANTYRKEIIADLPVDLGGSKMKNLMEDYAAEKFGNTKDMAATVWGRVQVNRMKGLVTTEVDEDGNKRRKLNNIFAGAGTALKEERQRQKASGDSFKAYMYKGEQKAKHRLDESQNKVLKKQEEAKLSTAQKKSLSKVFSAEQEINRASMDFTENVLDKYDKRMAKTIHRFPHNKKTNPETAEEVENWRQEWNAKHPEDPV